MEDFYDKLPLESTSDWDKSGLGKQILGFYNKMKLENESKVFFQKFQSDFNNKKGETTLNKINRLMCYSDSDNRLSPGQTKAQLEVVEPLLPQLTNSIEYKHALAMISERYVPVDRQKSIKLLENYENQQAKSRLIAAAIIPIVMGVLSFYPQARPFLLIGLPVVVYTEL